MDVQVHLKTLDEVREYYQTELVNEIQEQMDELKAVIDELFESWSGVHADSFHKSICDLLYGAGGGSGGTASFQAVRQRAEAIGYALEEGERVYLLEMSRCDTFSEALTDDSFDVTLNPGTKSPGDESLMIDYEAVIRIYRALEELTDGKGVFENSFPRSVRPTSRYICPEFSRRSPLRLLHPGQISHEV